MKGYPGQHQGLRASLYVELLPSEWFPVNNPFLTSESNTLGLTKEISPEIVAATRFRNEAEQETG